MVTLEQVEQLEARVQQVVAIVGELRSENERLRLERKQLESDFNVLRERYEAATSKAGALEGAQLMVEKGIMEAIDMLEEASRHHDDEVLDQGEVEAYIIPDDGDEVSSHEN